jgi:hypothetical protein
MPRGRLEVRRILKIPLCINVEATSRVATASLEVCLIEEVRECHGRGMEAAARNQSARINGTREDVMPAHGHGQSLKTPRRRDSLRMVSHVRQAAQSYCGGRF